MDVLLIITTNMLISSTPIPVQVYTMFPG